MLGQIMLTARRRNLEEEADCNGVLVWDCKCGKRFKGIVKDEDFCTMIYIHIEECPLSLSGVALYPVDSKDSEGRCLECQTHEQTGGNARCKNVFMDKDGLRKGRCSCRSKEHKQNDVLCDSSQRRR